MHKTILQKLQRTGKECQRHDCEASSVNGASTLTILATATLAAVLTDVGTVAGSDLASIELANRLGTLDVELLVPVVAEGVANVGKRANVSTATNRGKLRQVNFAEVATKNQGAVDGLELVETSNVLQGVVGSDGQITSDVGNSRERNVQELGVVGEGQTTGVLDAHTNLSKIGTGNRLHLVVPVEVESNDLLQDRDLEGSDTRDLADASLLELRERNSHLVTVGGNFEVLQDSLDIGIVTAEKLVVGQVETVNLVEGDAAEVLGTGVANLNGGDIDAARANGKSAKRADVGELDGVNALNKAEVNTGKLGEANKLHVLVDIGEGATGNRLERRRVKNLQATTNALDLLDIELAGHGRVNDNITSDLFARDILVSSGNLEVFAGVGISYSMLVSGSAGVGQ